MRIFVDISPGELLDKMTILFIKEKRIKDPAKLKNIRKETKLLAYKYDTLRNRLAGPEDEKLAELMLLFDQLQEVNEKLWDIEDQIRDLENKKDFGDKFIQTARSVYINNDYRAQIKRSINELLDSEIIEEKSYKDYK